MKTSVKLSLGFLCLFGIILILSLNKGYSITIASNTTEVDLKEMTLKARSQGINLMIDKLNYKDDKIASIGIHISSEVCQTSFLQERPFDLIEISANTETACNISFDVHFEEPTKIKPALSFILSPSTK